jgi:hypothetical protein
MTTSPPERLAMVTVATRGSWERKLVFGKDKLVANWPLATGLNATKKNKRHHADVLKLNELFADATDEFWLFIGLMD